MKYTPKINLSDIIHQVENGGHKLECLGPFRTDPDNKNPPFILYFRLPHMYAANMSAGWFYMRVWIAEEGKEGYLRAKNSYFDLVKDVPLQMLWDVLAECYVMGKIANDPVIMNPRTQYGPYFIPREMELYCNTFKLHEGFYEKPAMPWPNATNDYLQFEERLL